MYGHVGHDVLDWILHCQDLEQMMATARDPADNKHFEHLDDGQLCKAEVFFKAGSAKLRLLPDQEKTFKFDLPLLPRLRVQAQFRA